MPRLPPLSEEQVRKAREDLGIFTDNMGGTLPNSVLTLARRPNILKAVTDLWYQTIIEPGTVPRGLKWLAAHVASVSAGCQYCAAHTGENSAISEVPAEKIEAVWDYETSPLFTNAERCVLRLAQGMAQVPNMVSDDDFKELRKHWDDEQVVEIVAAVATFGFFNRWNDTMATELESSPTRFAEAHLSAAGWTLGKHGGE